MNDEVSIKEVYVAVVTIPKLEKVEIGSETFNRFKSTYTDYKEYLNDKQVVQSYFDNAGKSVAFNRIYQIALGFELNDTIRISVLNGKEEDIIREFHTLLTSHFKDAKLYGYNNEFLYDVLNFRGRVNKIPLEIEAIQVKDIKSVPWKQTKSVCLMNETVSSYRGKISLLNALYGAELDYKGILPGEDVFTYYQSNRLNEIDNSSAAIIKGLINLKRFLENKEQIFDFNLKVQEVGKAEKKDINVLEHLLASGQLSTKAVEAIVEFTNENNLNKEDVLTLVKAALSKTKSFQNLLEEDYIELKEALGLVVDYSKIECVVEKGNCGKVEANTLIKLYKNTNKEEKETIVNLVEQYLTENNKITQKRAKEAFDYLKEQLI